MEGNGGTGGDAGEMEGVGGVEGNGVNNGSSSLGLVLSGFPGSYPGGKDVGVFGFVIFVIFLT